MFLLICILQSIGYHITVAGNLYCITAVLFVNNQMAAGKGFSPVKLRKSDNLLMIDVFVLEKNFDSFLCAC